MITLHYKFVLTYFVIYLIYKFTLNLNVKSFANIVSNSLVTATLTRNSQQPSYFTPACKSNCLHVPNKLNKLKTVQYTPHYSHTANVEFHTKICHKCGRLAMTFLWPFFPLSWSDLVQLCLRIDEEMFSICRQTVFTVLYVDSHLL